jgi:hypothetical protein
MQIEEGKVTRRKLVGWLGFLSLFTVAGAAMWPGRNKKVSKTVKMLTQDGTLVEVDAEFLASARKRISDKELQGWVKK